MQENGSMERAGTYVATKRDTISGIPHEYNLRMNMIPVGQGGLITMFYSMDAAKIAQTPSGKTRHEVIDGGKDHKASEKAGRDLFKDMDGIVDRGFGQITQPNGVIRPLGNMPRDSSQALYLDIASKFLQ